MAIFFWNILRFFAIIILGVLLSAIISLVQLYLHGDEAGFQLIKSIFPAIVLSISTSFAKLSVSIKYLPLFLILGTVGLVEGLVQRYLRKIGGGHESALVYHFARRSLFRCLTYSVFIYLVLPIKINPANIYFPFAIIFGLMVSLFVKFFKKYL